MCHMTNVPHNHHTYPVHQWQTQQNRLPGLTRVINVTITFLLLPAWLALRFIFGLGGWVTVLYVPLGLIFTCAVGLLATVVFWKADDVPQTRRAWTLYLIGVALHIASAITLDDFGDAPDSHVLSPVSHVVGSDVSYVVGMIMLVAWLVISIASLVMARKAHRRV